VCATFSLRWADSQEMTCSDTVSMAVPFFVRGILIPDVHRENPSGYIRRKWHDGKLVQICSVCGITTFAVKNFPNYASL